MVLRCFGTFFNPSIPQSVLLSSAVSGQQKKKTKKQIAAPASGGLAMTASVLKTHFLETRNSKLFSTQVLWYFATLFDP